MIKRIAMLSVHTSPLATLGGKETGGMNVYVRDLSREFSRRGIEVDIYTRSQEPTAAYIQQLAEHSRVIQVKAGLEQPYNKNLIYNHLAEFVDGVQKFHRSNGFSKTGGQYDVIFSHYWLSGLVALELRQLWQTPFVQMFHTLAEMKNQVAQSSAEREPELRLHKEAEIMRVADRLIAATPIEENQMVELYGASPQKISVVPPGVDLDRFRPMDKKQARSYIDVSPNHRMILFVGRIQPLKGIDTLIRALALIKQRDPTLAQTLCVCIIGGSATPDSELERLEVERLNALRASLDIQNLVAFSGAKEQDILIYYYSAAEMVVMPSHYESFGMVAIEAMACGTPVIASDVGGLSFSIESGFNGYLVPGQNPEALANKILLLLKYPRLREQLSDQAQAWVRRFSWSNIADELIEVFQQLGSSSPIRPDLTIA